MGNAGAAEEPDGRADVDDLASALLAHVGDDGPGAEEDASHVDVHDPVPLVEVDFQHGACGQAVVDAGIVDDAVDAAKALHRLAGHLKGVFLVGDVGMERQDLCTGLDAHLGGVAAVADVADTSLAPLGAAEGVRLAEWWAVP